MNHVRSRFRHESAGATGFWSEIVELHPNHKADLLAVVEALLCEIAAALATGESGDDQDHG